MSFDDITYDVAPTGVATIVLNRPQVRNAMRLQSYAELCTALQQADADEAVRAVLVTGSGAGFCAGDDFSDIFLSESKSSWQHDRRVERLTGNGLNGVVEALTTMEKPTVAAVNGPAVGMGMDLSLLCDIRYASDRATFGSFFVRRGIVGTIGGTYFLRHVVGLSRALELLLTGDLIDANEADRIGLVSRVVPHDALMAKATLLAERLASGPPLAQRAIKRVVRQGLVNDWRTLDEYSMAISDVLWETRDHMEGVAAFMEKRSPTFTGS